MSEKKNKITIFNSKFNLLGEGNNLSINSTLCLFYMQVILTKKKAFPRIGYQIWIKKAIKSKVSLFSPCCNLNYSNRV
jgi:hypothetical protein